MARSGRRLVPLWDIWCAWSRLSLLDFARALDVHLETRMVSRSRSTDWDCAMQVSVIGCGYLGAVHAASMAELGHDVVGIDVDEAKVALLQAGKAPFHEPGFDELLERNVSAGRLRFCTDFAAVAPARVAFVGVGKTGRALC